MARAIPQVDVCIICALEEEADAVEQEVSEHCQTAFATGTTDDGRFVYRYTTITNNKQEPLTLFLFCQTHPGPVSAAHDVGSLLKEFQPRFAGMSGICAGDKRHLRLGDLVVAEYAYHFEEGKVTRDQQGLLVHQPDGITYGPASHLLRYIRTFKAWKTPVAALKKHVFHTGPWVAQQDVSSQPIGSTGCFTRIASLLTASWTWFQDRTWQIAKSTSTGSPRKRASCCAIRGTDEPQRCVAALMASGMAVRSDDPFGALQRQHRKTWALDMEAASFYLALRDFPGMDGLVVKGVCDYADLFKDNAFHDFAARASAIYLLTLIQEYVTTETLRQECRGPLPVFTVPYQRNLFFTGRDELLTQIHTHFQTQQATALALSGLGGIGKTQIALEYAYQHHQDYQAVLWSLADTHESLVSGYVAIAGLLKLPEKDEKDQTIVVKAVLHWLTTQSKWFLILDNADDLAMAREFIPSAYSGHILLTTHAQAMGRLAQRIEVDTIPQDIGALFLLRRASLIAANAPLEDAAASDIVATREICKELGGLPLALDQAGAYIEETRCSLSDFLECYQMHRDCLLKRRGGLIADHPQSVATAFSFAFEQVKQKNAAALELLKLASYLGPDAIPLELITQEKVYLGAVLEPVVTDEFQLDQALETLQAYSLIQRDGKNRTLSIHRLVQAVLQDNMTPRERVHWKRRALRAVSVTLCDRCRKETGKRAEEQVATYFDSTTGKELVSRYRLPLYCDDCQEDLRVLAEDQTTFALAREKATLGIGG
jgi:nucleoside phosphorylase